MSNTVYRKYMSLITYTLILVFILVHVGKIGAYLWKWVIILKPLWYGIALAFTLNVPMKQLETKVFKANDKSSRITSLIVALSMVIILILILVIWVIPDFIESLTFLVGQIPDIARSFNSLLKGAFSNTSMVDYIDNFNGTGQVTEVLSGIFKGIISNFTSILSNFAGFLVNIVTGIIIAVYLLLEKEPILEKCKMVIKKIFDQSIVKKIKYVYNISYKAFHDFITYQCLECFVLATIMFIAFIIFRFPYALTIAFLTGVTAIVPIFGATIACVIGAILVGTVSIEKMIIFIAVFQIIQQIENNLIYPHVVGKNVGIPPILTLIAIIVGGKVMGLFGVLVCVPVTSILNTLFWSIMEKDIPKINVKRKKIT